MSDDFRPDNEHVLVPSTHLRLPDNDNDDMEDVAEAKAIAQLASGANATQVQQLITSANKFDNDNDDNWAGTWKNGDIYDDDWQAIAALAASGQLNVVGNSTGAVLSFINATLPKSANAQALYTNISGIIQKQVQAAKAYVLRKLVDMKFPNSIFLPLAAAARASQCR